MKNAVKILCTLLLASNLVGCVGVFLAGAAAGGLVVYERRSIDTINKDQQIRHQIGKRMADDESLKNSHISVACFNQMVLLVGQTPYASQRARAQRIANSVPGVKKLYNEINIVPTTGPKIRSNDTWITMKVKADLLGAKDLHSGEIKVVTENATVYLMGIVSHKQANRAVSVAKQVSGVRKIVKVFRYI